MSSSTRIERRSLAENLATVAAVLVLLFGLSVVVGWHTGTALLVQVRSDLAPVQYNTAICFSLGGVAWWLLIAGRRRLAAAAAVMVLATAGATLVEYGTGIDLGIDQLLVWSGRFANVADAGPMALNTTLGMLLCGGSLLALAIGGRRWPLLGGVLAASAAALGTLGMIGYVSGIESIYGWGSGNGMAAQTAAGLILAGLGLFAWAWRQLPAPTHRWLPLPISLAVVLLVTVLWQALAAWQQHRLESELTASADAVISELETALDRRLANVEQLATRWPGRGGEPERIWRQQTQVLLSRRPGLAAVGLLDASAGADWLSPATTGPLSGELAIDVLEELRPTLAAERGRVLLPLTLNVGECFVVAAPLSGAAAAIASDGHVVAIVPMVDVFDSIALRTGSLGLALVARAAGREVFSAGAEVADAARLRQRHELVVAGRRWQVELWPTPAWIASRVSVLPEVVLVTGLIIALLLAVSVALAQELASRRGEEEMRRLLEVAPDPIVLVDEAGIIRRVNRQAAELLGYSVAELLGQPLELLLPEQLRERHCQYREEFQRAPRTRAMGIGLALFARHRDGHELPVDVRLGPFELRGRTFVLASIRDVSGRRQVEESLARDARALATANAELERFNRLAVGREERMIELKREVNKLRARLGEPALYDTVEGEAAVAVTAEERKGG